MDNLNYRLVYEDKDGIHATEFMEREKAEEIYNGMLEEKDPVTIWCDLEFLSPIVPGDKKIISQFTRKTRYECGRLIILPTVG